MRSSKIDKILPRKLIFDSETGRLKLYMYLAGEVEINEGNKGDIIWGNTHIDTAEGFIVSDTAMDLLFKFLQSITLQVEEALFNEEVPDGVMGYSADSVDLGDEGFNDSPTGKRNK